MQANEVKHNSRPARNMVVAVVFPLWQSFFGLKVINKILDLKRKHLRQWTLVF